MALRIILVLMIYFSAAYCFAGDAQQFTNDTLPDDHLMIVLESRDGRLTGGTEYLPGFTFTMDVSDSTIQPGFNYNVLINHVRMNKVEGILFYPNDRETKIIYELIDFSGEEKIYMKTTLGYFLWEWMDIQDDRVTFVINWWYCPPAQKIDLDIIKMSKQFLRDSSSWHKEDDRRCDDDIHGKKWSLFCVLKFASTELTGEYNHHNTSMQMVRFAIDEIKPEHVYDHTLMDYNNDPSTSHSDILHVLDMAENRISAQLGKQGE